MAEILVFAINKTNPDPDIDRRGCYKKGYPVVIKPDGWGWGGEERLPKFVLVKCPQVTVEQIINKANEWRLEISYEQVAHDPVLDGYRIRVKADNVSVSGGGALTRDKVENYLGLWGATIFSTASNEVVFDAGIYNAIKSQGFWEGDISTLVFDEISYDQETGIHRVQANYSASTYGSQKIENAVKVRGATVIQNDVINSIITFEIDRATVFNVFKSEVKAKVDITYCRRQYYFTEAQVDQVIAAGGEIILSAVQLNSAVHNKLDE